MDDVPYVLGDDPALWETLRGFRLMAPLTQQELADRVGEPLAFVVAYECGTYRLDFDEMMRVCEALGQQLQAVQEMLETIGG
jgi:transcriptional regulator with XRE-family HTH domain